jgi:hypothetical protein
LHLHPSGKAERTGTFAHFAKRPPKSLTGIQVPPGVRIRGGHQHPAGEANYTIKIVPAACRCRKLRHAATHLCQDEARGAPARRFNPRTAVDQGLGLRWQDSHFFKELFRFPKGTRIDADRFTTPDANPTTELPPGGSSGDGNRSMKWDPVTARGVTDRADADTSRMRNRSTCGSRSRGC